MTALGEAMVIDRDDSVGVGALVRPYAVTRGRTRPRLDIAMEALVETTARGRMQMPLGVARVLVADMAADGLLAVHEPAGISDGDDVVGTELLERVLSGLRRL
jgi:hypothetical protein